MENKSFTIYSEQYVYCCGEIVNGKLEITSDVYGDYDSELIYSLSRMDTEKLFSNMTLDEFIERVRADHISGLDNIFQELDIHPNKMCF